MIPNTQAKGCVEIDTLFHVKMLIKIVDNSFYNFRSHLKKGLLIFETFLCHENKH